MKNRILSTLFGVVLALAVVLPINPSLVNVNNPELDIIGGGSCVIIKTVDGKVKVCNDGIQPLDVSWNSGGG